jgi:hypothetical protein
MYQAFLASEDYIHLQANASRVVIAKERVGGSDPLFRSIILGTKSPDYGPSPLFLLGLVHQFAHQLGLIHLVGIYSNMAV